MPKGKKQRSVAIYEPPNNKSLPITYQGFIAGYKSRASQLVINHNIKKFIAFIHSAGYTQDTINQDILNLYFQSLRDRGLGNATYNQNMSCVCRFLKYIGKPGFEFKHAKVESFSNMAHIGEEEFKNILVYIDGKVKKGNGERIKYLRDLFLFQLAGATGLRKNEIISLKHDDITERESGIYYYRAVIKGGQEITKKFPPELVELWQELKLKEGKGNADYIFTRTPKKPRTKLNHSSLNYILNFYFKKVTGRKDKITVHSIRNLSAQMLYEEENNILRVQQHLNHKNLNTTQKYLGVLEQEIDYRPFFKRMKSKSESERGLECA